MKGVPHEHEYEAVHGLPEKLPAGERMLWQGAPDWQMLARDAMHLPMLATYFAVLLAWRAGAAWIDTGSAMTALGSMVVLLPLALLALGTLAMLAWLTSRNTVYTITNKRVVMRIGIVLTVTFNLPFSQIESASLRRHANGTGDIALALVPGDNIAYLHLWPHARAWHVRRTQPQLRCIPDCLRVSQLLVAAIGEGVTAGSPPVRVPAPERAVRPAASPANDPLTA